jgi:hypothetical protein
MKINDKHKYDVDVIEIKIFLDAISKDRFDQNFINTYNLIINTSIGSLGLTVDKIKEIVTNKYYLSLLEEDLRGQLFFALVSYQLSMVQGHRIQLVLDYHLQNTKYKDKFINQIEFFVLGQLENYNEELLEDFRLYEVTEWVIRNRSKKSSSYNSSKKLLENKESTPIDDRIDCNEDVEYIEEYFMKLNNIIGKDGKNPIMEKDDIIHFLKANFKGFTPIEKIKKFELNFNIENPFTYFIYEFYCSKISQQRRHHKEYYIDLLFNNFTMYDAKERTTVRKNFSREPKKKLKEYKI